MDDELRLLSRLINKQHWVRAWKLAAHLARTELSNSTHFWFQVGLLASLTDNNQLREAAKNRMKQCSDYTLVLAIDFQRDNGLDHLRHGRIDEAIASFADSFKLLGSIQPEDFNRIALNQACLGMAKAAQRDYPAATEAFRRALGIWTEKGLWSPPAHRFRGGNKPPARKAQVAPKNVILQELRPDSNMQWVINSTFHFLKALTAADNPLLQDYVRACRNFVVRCDPSLARRVWAQLFFVWGAPATNLYAQLEKLRYRR